MRIASWNVNSIRMRLGHVLDWLDNTAPDVLFLQELKGIDFPEQDFARAGYQCCVKPEKGRNGVATLSKEPLTLIRDVLPGDDTDTQARYLETALGGLRLINIYAPNGNPAGTEKFAFKLAWLERLRLYLRELRAQEIPFLVGGDFNVIPQDRDCADPAAMAEDALILPESRAAFRALEHMGLYDAFRVLHPDETAYTFWDYQAGAWQRNHGLRIDHFLLSPALTDRLTGCEIDKTPRSLDKPSDHVPVTVALSL